MKMKALILASDAALAVGPAFAASGAAAGDVTGTAAPASGSSAASGSTPAPATGMAPATGTTATMGTSGTASVTAKAPVSAKMATQAVSKAGMHAPDAERHFKDIASGRIGAMLSQYSPHATLNWVGGKLNGTYRGHEAIKDVWQRYEHDMGKATVRVSDVKVRGDKQGMTVTADVLFTGKMKLPVRYVLVYRGHKIVDEVWQLAPHSKAM